MAQAPIGRAGVKFLLRGAFAFARKPRQVSGVHGCHARDEFRERQVPRSHGKIDGGVRHRLRRLGKAEDDHQARENSQWI